MKKYLKSIWVKTRQVSVSDGCPFCGTDNELSTKEYRGDLVVEGFECEKCGTKYRKTLQFIQTEVQEKA
jgi:Zn ribbon nucleic-acid-binding protein